jgi:hypothetical protein
MDESPGSVLSSAAVNAPDDNRRGAHVRGTLKHGHYERTTASAAWLVDLNHVEHVDDRETRTADDRARLDQRLRAAFFEGAEEDSLRPFGRGLTVEEPGRVLRRYPRDVRERREP